MIFYLTGASSSLAKNPSISQTDPAKSLGGYVSVSPVPNGNVNSLFDSISLKTLNERPTECVAIALVNAFDFPVYDINLKTICHATDQAHFEIAAVSIADNAMEHINSRYAQPIMAEFHNANFSRAGVDVTIKTTGFKGEQITFEPFGITATIQSPAPVLEPDYWYLEEDFPTIYDNVWDAIEEAFADNPTYTVIRKDGQHFRIERLDNIVVEPTICTYTTTGNSSFEFATPIQNEFDNSVFLVDELPAGGMIGLWIKRSIKKVKKTSYEQMIEDYKLNKPKIQATTEEVDIVVEYETTNPNP